MEKPRLLVIGSSAGGSETVERVLAELPTGAGLRILVVQHMLDSFTERFARRLDAASGYSVREAGFEDEVGEDGCLVAKGDHHMEVTGYDDGVTVELTKGRRSHGVRPSIDVTMETAAEVLGGSVVGVVLSGMGSDGVEGVKAIHRHGGVTVAQDEESSTVYGMPRRAVETGCIDHVVAGDEIPDRLAEVAGAEA